MREASKIRQEFLPLLKGRVLDIGCGDDKVVEMAEPYDVAQGDAQTCWNLTGPYDTIFSSHCLEHMEQPQAALRRWWDLLAEGGFLILVVPDEDLYEQGHWPSCFNGDHKATFTPSKSSSWSPVSLNVVDLIKNLPGHKLFSLRVVDEGYDHDAEGDQTLVGAKANIEVVVQKVPQAVLGTWRRDQPSSIEWHVSYDTARTDRS
jgi:SAM-dependent methyltransferase